MKTEELLMVKPPPAHLLEIIRLAWSADASVQRLGGLASQDPEFSSSVLRYINGGTIGIHSRVDNSQRAALLLGAKALGALAICHAVVITIQEAELEKSVRDRLLEDCTRRAAAAIAVSALFKQVTADVAVAVGFCTEVGKVISLVRDPSLAIWFDNVRQLHGDARIRKEREYLNATHVEDFEHIAQALNLPRDIARPVRVHHEGDSDDRPDRLREVALLSDLIAEVWTAAEPQEAMKAAAEALNISAGLTKKEAETLVASVGQKGDDLAEVLGVVLPSSGDLARKLRGAEQDVSEMDRDDLVRKLEEMRAEKRLQARHIDELKLRIQALSQQDMLTSLPTRQRWFLMLRNELQSVGDGELSLILVDIDRLEEHNQRYGQAAGDEIICRVGAMLQRMVRETDFLARVDGDCFGILMPRTDTAGGRVLAERVRAAIEMMKLDLGGQRIVLSGTVAGLTTGDGERIERAETFHARVEAHLERIKGCNRASWAA
ncbi:MAG: diguanylate cyclase [Proteobacteria bacterium]|nr:diguanylate cyclase [Pseudomonadota bacterium]MCP4921731.1 diguanylate cyclase [Pseudomonadota bacterium]